MSPPRPTTMGALLLGLSEAQTVAEIMDHPAAKPLAAVAEALRDGENQPETDVIAEVLAAWLVLGSAATPARRRYRPLSVVPDITGSEGERDCGDPL